ncbi:MAG TPA: methyltransferase domain-containing protein [Stenomitos sp.]
MLESKGSSEVAAIRDHYDRVSVFYRALWGDHIHHGYFEGRESPKWAQLKLIERLAEMAAIPPGSSVLDVGCGVGGSARWLAKELDCTVLGITLSPVQARMAAEAAAREGLGDRARFAIKDAHRLDFPAESFDAVWVIECSEHLLDKPGFIRACHRVLKPGGTMALCAWLSAERFESDAQEQLVAAVCEGMLCPSLGSMRDYVAWLREAGFDAIRAEDVTERVKATWQLCGRIVERPEVQLLARMSDPAIRGFVQAFGAIRRAYDEGAMSYGMLTAKKASPRPI